jgi:hypothetical protein
MADTRLRRRTIGATAVHAATHYNRCPGLPGPALPCTGSVPQCRRARRGARGLHRIHFGSCIWARHFISQHTTPLDGHRRARTHLINGHRRWTRRMARYGLRTTAHDRANTANWCSLVFFGLHLIPLHFVMRRLRAYYLFSGWTCDATSDAHARTRV